MKQGEIGEMRCQHCHEELERWTADDPAARCPECGLVLAESPIEFTEVPLPSERANDLAAIERLVASLEQHSPELFLFPTTPKIIVAEKNNRFVEQVVPTPPTTTTDNILLAVQNVLAAPINEAMETASMPLLTWLLLGCGALAMLGGFTVLIAGYLIEQVNGWSLGMFLILGGQTALLVGLLMCLDYFRRALQNNQARLAEQRTRCQLARDLAYATLSSSGTSRAA